ncbi:MAG: Fur family transcriptional regulator [Elusimicrobiales bacterium]|nr:Fur family transcriptional regulator [Elusimicrobiales bacterium]
MENARAKLRSAGIRPTAHRLAVAARLFGDRTHPTADRIWDGVREDFPAISRATVYNTLDLFVERKLVLRRALDSGAAVYDPFTEPHHHLVDEATGHVYDIPWGEVRLGAEPSLKDFDVSEFYLVMRGRRRAAGPKRKS